MGTSATPWHGAGLPVTEEVAVYGALFFFLTITGEELAQDLWWTSKMDKNEQCAKLNEYRDKLPYGTSERAFVDYCLQNNPTYTNEVTLGGAAEILRGINPPKKVARTR